MKLALWAPAAMRGAPSFLSTMKEMTSIGDHRTPVMQSHYEVFVFLGVSETLFAPLRSDVALNATL